MSQLATFASPALQLPVLVGAAGGNAPERFFEPAFPGLIAAEMEEVVDLIVG
jgi:hypothetical protein